MNLIAKHSSNIEKLQRKIVKYGRRNKKLQRRKKVVTFFVFFTMLMNLRAKHPSNREKLQNHREEKKLLPFL